MNASDHPTTALQQAAHAMTAVLGGLDESAWILPTPCSEWNLAALVDHVVEGNVGFLRALGAGAPALEDDRVRAVEVTSTALVEAFQRPGALEQTVTVPFGAVPAVVALDLRSIELVVHGWDVARALGRQLAIDDALVEPLVDASARLLAALPAGRHPFAPSVASAQGASAVDRLVAQLGRDPGWVAAP